MAQTIGQHSLATFTSPVNGTTPIDANTVRGNDNTIQTAYNAHDGDPGVHLQSSDLSSRPAAGTAGRKWLTADTGSYRLFFDDGSTWRELSYFSAAGGTISGNVSITGTLGVTSLITASGGVSGNLTGNVTGNVTGNATTATTLATARTINGVSFDGSANITVTAAAGTLTGSTLASGVTASSLTSVGTLTALTVSGNTGFGGANVNGYRAEVTGTTQANASYGMTYQGVAAATIGVTSAGALAFGLDASSGSTGRWQINASGHFLAATDATYNIGASGANRPNNIYAAGNGVFGGNLGLGTAPYAWSGVNAAQVKGASLSSSSTDLYLSANVYFDGSFRYGVTDYATRYQQYQGVHSWYTAASGTAGNAISFTQAMTLDASGNLLVGTTSGYRGGRLVVKDTNKTQTSTTANLHVSTTDAQAANIGGSIGLGGLTGSDETPYAYISGRKENSTSGNLAGYFAIATQDGGGTVAERWRINSSGHFLAGTDASYDIGASGANRPRDAYISNSLVVKSSTGQFILGGTTSATYPSFGAANTGEFIYSADKHRFFNKTGATEKASFDMATGNATFTGKAGIGSTGTLVYQLEVQAASGADRDIVLAGVNGVTNGFTVKWNNTTSKTLVNIANIPTAAAGLPAGTLYNDAGTIKIA